MESRLASSPRTYGVVFAVLFIASFAMAAPLEDKGPPYFVDRYGPAVSSRTVAKDTFFSSVRGGAAVKGPFSVRTFRKDRLQVEAVFFLPSLKLAAVKLQLRGGSWTEEQTAAALKAYGGEWKLIKGDLVKEWVAPDGTGAIHLISSLHIQSKEVMDLVTKELAEQDAKRKAVPTF